MSCYRRPKRPGASVFFTVNLAERGSNLLLDEIDLLRWAVAKTLRERPVGVDAWVILPDHMHAIWTLPEGDVDFSTRWRLIKARFSRSVPKGQLRDSHVLRQERGVWQRRFWEHHIRNRVEFASLVEHCRVDPVTHGLVSQPEHWRFSSFARKANAQIGKVA